MPNWCHNKLIVSGRSIDVWDFQKQNIEDAELDFNKSVPQPKFENDSDWYGWNIENWGTKWQPNTEKVEIELTNNFWGSLTISFETAWNFPMTWFKKVVEKYPRLQFSAEYYDESLEWKGFLKANKGEIIVNNLVETPESN